MIKDPAKSDFCRPPGGEGTSQNLEDDTAKKNTREIKDLSSNKLPPVDSPCRDDGSNRLLAGHDSSVLELWLSLT